MLKIAAWLAAAFLPLQWAIPVSAQELPEGRGKEIVASVCGGCHPVGRIRAGYSPAGWHSVMTMMRNMEAPVPAGAWPVVEAYLVKNFPEKPKPAGKTIPGPAKISIEVWKLPTPGSRPHDPMAARDGSIWYTGQTANLLGRIDPKTGAIKEFHLKTPHTGPHGLKEDAGGNIWFTGNNSGLIGRLDPKTGAVTEYPLPDADAHDPHTLIFDRDGILWFTVQQANKVGRLDPKTGEIKLVTVPTPNAHPYGMALDSQNRVFFVEFNSNKVAAIDRATMQIREWVLPDPGARPRRIAIGPGDIVWYTDFARGYLGRLDPASGSVSEWQSPAGPRSEPYGIVFAKGAVWYSESGAKPNTVVRFDPQRQKFQSWTIPGGGDIVRNMDVTRDGNPIMANSLVNEVGLVTIK